MHLSKWTDIALCLVLVAGAAGALVSCSDVGDNTAAPPEDGGNEAGPEDVGTGAESGALEDGSQGSNGDSTVTPDAVGQGGDAGSTGTGVPDSGTADTGLPDAGAPDTGTSGDTGTDTGVHEAGPDTGAPEGGGTESGAPEGGVTESGAPEGGHPESGAPEGGAPESGAPEGGPHDGGGHDGGGPDGGNPCGPDSTTQACIGAQAPDCLACAMSNSCLDPTMGGGNCEAISSTATLLTGALPDSTTCTSVVGAASVSETRVCLQTLAIVFASKCAATFQETPCLCGATDNTACLAGSATPTGVTYDIDACDLGSTSAVTIVSRSQDLTTGIGQANLLVQCLGSFGCTSCFGQ